MKPWTHLLTDTVTVAHEEKTTNYGDPCFGEQYELKARVEYGTKMLKDPEGNTVESVAAVTTEAQIPRNARVWLPGDDVRSDTAGRVPLAVRRAALPGSHDLYETRF